MVILIHSINETGFFITGKKNTSINSEISRRKYKMADTFNSAQFTYINHTFTCMNDKVKSKIKFILCLTKYVMTMYHVLN